MRLHLDGRPCCNEPGAPRPAALRQSQGGASQSPNPTADSCCDAPGAPCTGAGHVWLGCHRPGAIRSLQEVLSRQSGLVAPAACCRSVHAGCSCVPAAGAACWLGPLAGKAAAAVCGWEGAGAGDQQRGVPAGYEDSMHSAEGKRESQSYDDNIKCAAPMMNPLAWPGWLCARGHTCPHAQSAPSAVNRHARRVSGSCWAMLRCRRRRARLQRPSRAPMPPISGSGQAGWRNPGPAGLTLSMQSRRWARPAAAEHAELARREKTLHWAIQQQLKHPPKGFAEVIRRHFFMRRHALLHPEIAQAQAG